MQYFRLKDELRRLEEGDAPGQGGSSSGQERISFRDIDALTRDRGATLTRRQIEVRIIASVPNCTLTFLFMNLFVYPSGRETANDLGGG